jgi:acetyltransferase-like isoleucine patch superfamily enzyme
VIYAASRFESRLETGHKVTLRERITAGHNLRVGTYTDIQGDVEIGNFVRMHSNVHISKFTKIGDCVWIFPFTVTTNDPIPPSNQHKGAVLEDFCIVSTASVLLPGIRIGKYSIVGAKSTVTRDVEPRTLVIGSPAKFIKMISEIKLPDGSDAYPWHKHLKEQYIEEIKAYYSG